MRLVPLDMAARLLAGTDIHNPGPPGRLCVGGSYERSCPGSPSGVTEQCPEKGVHRGVAYDFRVGGFRRIRPGAQHVGHRDDQRSGVHTEKDRLRDPRSNTTPCCSSNGRTPRETRHDVSPQEVVSDLPIGDALSEVHRPVFVRLVPPCAEWSTVRRWVVVVRRVAEPIARGLSRRRIGLLHEGTGLHHEPSGGIADPPAAPGLGPLRTSPVHEGRRGAGLCYESPGGIADPPAAPGLGPLRTSPVHEPLTGSYSTFVRVFAITATPAASRYSHKPYCRFECSSGSTGRAKYRARRRRSNLARPDSTGSDLRTGMKQREKTTSYSPGSNPQPPSPLAVRVTSPSRPTKAVVLTGSLGTEADVTRREIGQ